MVITPNSDVILLKCPLELDQENQLNFANATTQYNYFYGLTKYVAGTNFTYQRKDGIIRIPAKYDDLISYNYVMYRNDNYSNKWFYAFIEKMEYVNDGMTSVKIKTDVFQTWQFDLTYKKTFVEREHVNDDTVGKHTLPESLDLGEYVLNGAVSNNCYVPSGAQDPTAQTNVMYTCIQVSDYPDGAGEVSPSLGTDVKGKAYGGVYSGLDYLFILDPDHVNRLVTCYDKANKADAIVAMFQVPLGVISSSNITFTTYTNLAQETMYIGQMTSNYVPITINTTTITKPTTVDGYTPVNKKVLTYPYAYFYVSNNAGREVTYHYEDFNGNPSFQVDCSVSQGMSIKAFPTNYKNGTNKDGYDFGITGGKLPVCAWNTDYYTNWCTQNALNTITQPLSALTSGTLGMVGSAMAGNPLGVVASGMSGLTGIAEALNTKYQASMTPDQARGNANCGDVNVAETRFGYTFYPMSIKAEYARIVDGYFTMYGYQVNEVKIPNVTGRTNWNYVKTINCYIQADIPQEDLQEIKDMFNRGLTIWHNTSTFMDYSQSNTIVS